MTIKIEDEEVVVCDLCPDTLDFLSALVLAGPLLIIGPPGVGKTASADDIARKVANSLNVADCIICRVPAPQVSIVDLYVPVPQLSGNSGWVIKYALSEQIQQAFERAQNNAAGVIVLDDITLAQPEVQPPMQAMTDAGEKMLAGHVVPPSLKIIATANPRNWGGEQLLASLRNRMAVVSYLPDPVKWADRFVHYWGKAKSLSPPEYPPEQLWEPWRQKVARFIKNTPSALCSDEPGEPDGKILSPRGWDLFSRALAWRNVQPSEENYETIRNIGGAYLPMRVVEAFASFVVFGELPSPEEVLADVPHFVERVERGEYSAAFSIIAQKVARYLQNNLSNPSATQAGLFLAEELKRRNIGNCYAVYLQFLTDVARSQEARRQAQRDNNVKSFIEKVSQLTAPGRSV